jgi:ABC-type Fe3+ transport system permease subunit
LTWAVSRFEFPGRRTAQALVVVPFVLPTVVVGTAFAALGWRGSIWAILAAHVFYNVAVVVRTVGGMWARLDRRVEEAAAMLGASPWTVFRTITFPLLRPAIIAAASIVFLFTFSSFGVILILGGFQYATLEVEIYRQAVMLFDLPLAAVLALAQLVGVSALLALYARRQERRLSARPRRRGQHPSAPARKRPARGGGGGCWESGADGDPARSAGGAGVVPRRIPPAVRGRPGGGAAGRIGPHLARVRPRRHRDRGGGGDQCRLRHLSSG